MSFFALLFSAYSGLIEIKAPEIFIIQVDVVPDLIPQRPVIEVDLDKRIPVDPKRINPKKLETTKGQPEAKPRPIMKEKEVDELTPTPVQQPTLEDTSIPVRIQTVSLEPIQKDLEVFSVITPGSLLSTGNRNSFGTDLRDGLDPIIMDCLKFLEFTETPQPCMLRPPLFPETVPDTEICRVELDVMADGTVENFVATDCPYPELLESTRIAAKDWRYVPAVVKGEKVVERRREVKVISCKGDLRSSIKYPEVCGPNLIIAEDVINKPMTLDFPRALDQEAVDAVDRIMKFPAQSNLSQDDRLNSTKKSPQQKLSLEDILK